MGARAWCHLASVVCSWKVNKCPEVSPVPTGSAFCWPVQSITPHTMTLIADYSFMDTLVEKTECLHNPTDSHSDIFFCKVMKERGISRGQIHDTAPQLLELPSFRPSSAAQHERQIAKSAANAGLICIHQ